MVIRQVLSLFGGGKIIDIIEVNESEKKVWTNHLK